MDKTSKPTKYPGKSDEKKAAKSAKYSGKSDEKVAGKIKKKKEEKKIKKNDRNVKLQEKKKIRVQQKNEKKLVSDMVELIRIIFPSFTDNEYYRKYFNMNQFIKLEMFSDFQSVKDAYFKGKNITFLHQFTHSSQSIVIFFKKYY